MRYVFLGCVLTVAGLLSGCGTSSASSRSVDGRPTVLRYCYTVTTEDPSATNHRMDLTKKYLERELHVRVEAVQTTSYGGVDLWRRTRSIV